MADNDDLQFTIAFLQDSTNHDPEPIEMGIPVSRSDGGLLRITSFPASIQREEEVSDCEDIHNGQNGVVVNESLHMEIQRLCPDYSNKCIEEGFQTAIDDQAEGNVNGESSNGDKKDFRDIEEMLRELERESGNPGSESTNPSLPTSKECSQQEEILPETNKEREDKTNGMEVSSERHLSAKFSRPKSKRRERKCNNAAIESILKIITPASQKSGTCSGDQRAQTNSAQLTDVADKTSDGHTLWNGSSSHDRVQGRFAPKVSVITNACINGYSPNADFVPIMDLDYPSFTSKDFPPLK